MNACVRVWVVVSWGGGGTVRFFTLLRRRDCDLMFVLRTLSPSPPPSISLALSAWRSPYLSSAALRSAQTLPAKHMASIQLSDARETLTTRDDEQGEHEAPNDETHAGTPRENITTSDSIRELKIGKHVCPEEYLNTFTPMEFEEVGGLDAGTELCRL